MTRIIILEELAGWSPERRYVVLPRPDCAECGCDLAGPAGVADREEAVCLACGLVHLVTAAGEPGAPMQVLPPERGPRTVLDEADLDSLRDDLALPRELEDG